MRKIKVVVLLVRQLQHGFTKNTKVFGRYPYRPLSRRLDSCDRVIQDESGDSNGGDV